MAPPVPVEYGALLLYVDGLGHSPPEPVAFLVQDGHLTVREGVVIPLKVVAYWRGGPVVF